MAGTYDGNAVKLYQNGLLVGSASVAGIVNNASGESLLIGKNANSGQFYAGIIDEVAIYGYALSGQRILDHYRMGK